MSSSSRDPAWDCTKEEILPKWCRKLSSSLSSGEMWILSPLSLDLRRRKNSDESLDPNPNSSEQRICSLRFIRLKSFVMTSAKLVGRIRRFSKCRVCQKIYDLCYGLFECLDIINIRSHFLQKQKSFTNNLNVTYLNFAPRPECPALSKGALCFPVS